MTGTEKGIEESQTAFVLKTILLAVLTGLIYWGTFLLFRIIVGALSRLSR